MIDDTELSHQSSLGKSSYTVINLCSETFFPFDNFKHSLYLSFEHLMFEKKIKKRNY